jgi:hypothetical protein
LFLIIDSSKSEKQINLIKFDLDKQYTINAKKFVDIKDLTIHIYIDHSVCEIIIGKIYCETKIIAFKQEDRFSLLLKVFRGEDPNIQSKIWNIDSIW